MTNTMKTRLKPLCIFFFFAVTLILFTAFTSIGAPLFTKAYGIPIGMLFMIVAIVWHILGSQYDIFYILGIIFNSVGMGFLASTYYCLKDVPSFISDLAPALVLPLAIMLAVSVILTLAPDIKHPMIVILAILELGLIIASIVFWCTRGGDFYAFSMFSLIVTGFYTGVLAFTVDEERELLRDISFGCFGAFFIIGIVVIIAISQGEACDGCDGGCDGCDCGGGSKKKSK